MQPELQTYVDTVRSLGGSVPITQLTAADRFVRAGKADGWIVPGRTFLWVAMGDFRAMPACLLSPAGVKACTVFGFVSADYSLNGLIGDGSTKYLETNAIPLNFVLAANQVVCGVCSHSSGESASCEIGAQSGGSARGQLILNQASVGVRARAFADTAGSGRLDILNPTGSGRSLTYWIRSAVGLTIGINGILQPDSSTGAGALPAVSLNIFCHNSSGARSLFSARRLSMAIMSPTVNIHRIYGRYRDFCRAIGREVV